MTDSRSLTPAGPSDFEQIEAAFAETARGRWFLTEYARRNRNADTDTLLAAIGRLESAVVTEQGSGGFRQFRGDLADMAEAIARTKSEIAAISAPENEPNRLVAASEALDAIVRQTEKATYEILGAAEEVQEAAWLLREAGTQSDLCDSLDRHATRIYTACSFQDLTAQRISRVVQTLRYLEKRIDSMMSIWGAEQGREAEDRHPPASASGVPLDIGDLCQSDVDQFLDPSAVVPEPVSTRPVPLSALALDDDIAFLPEREPVDGPTPQPPSAQEPSAAAPSDDLASAFDDLDALSIEEKIALFT